LTHSSASLEEERKLSKLDRRVEPLRGPRRRWICALLLVGLLGGACNRDGDEKADDEKSPDASAEGLAQYRKGSQLPDDWPTPNIPVPPGAEVVASVNAEVPGAGGDATTVLYSVTQTIQELHDFMQAELPKKGWNLLESSDPATSGVSVTSAEGNGYIGVFTAGEGLAPPDVLDSNRVALQIILASVPPTVEASPEGSPEASPKG
jgi:hypothetical protein